MKTSFQAKENIPSITMKQYSLRWQIKECCEKLRMKMNRYVESLNLHIDCGLTLRSQVDCKESRSMKYVLAYSRWRKERYASRNVAWSKREKKLQYFMLFSLQGLPI